MDGTGAVVPLSLPARLKRCQHRGAPVTAHCHGTRMALLRHTRSLRLSLPFKHPNLRLYATVNSPLIIAKPPNLPPPTSAPRPLDSFVLETLSRAPSTGRTALPQLIQQYLHCSGNLLDTQLPYEPRPSPSRRVSFSTDTGDDVHLIAHVARENDRSKVTVSSGFAVETADGVPILVTCAHTLEEVCRLPRCPVHVRVADVYRSVGLHCLFFLNFRHSPPLLTSLRRARQGHSSSPQ